MLALLFFGDGARFAGAAAQANEKSPVRCVVHTSHEDVARHVACQISSEQARRSMILQSIFSRPVAHAATGARLQPRCEDGSAEGTKHDTSEGRLPALANICSIGSWLVHGCR